MDLDCDIFSMNLEEVLSNNALHTLMSIIRPKWLSRDGSNADNDGDLFISTSNLSTWLTA
jgi:hypothetical protein